MYRYVIWLGITWKGLIRMLLGAFSYQTWRNTVTIPSKSSIYITTYIYIYVLYMILYITIYTYIYCFFRGSEGCGKFQHVSGFGGFSTCWRLAEPLWPLRWSNPHWTKWESRWSFLGQSKVGKPCKATREHLVRWRNGIQCYPFIFKCVAQT